ncbi:MAG: type II toxin-antitoxin system PemK/MazF family toxin [Sphingomonadaceae bacterium]
MTCERFDLFVVDFPFSEADIIKRRPAVAICDGDFVARTGNVLLAMITSTRHSRWPGDCVIEDLVAAGCRANPRSACA